VSHNAYDRELLRQQIQRLRQAAAERSRLEHEIASEHETETVAARQQAETMLAGVEEKYTRESEATRREHAAVIEKAEAEAVGDRTKLDTQRKGFAATINRNWENQQVQLKDEAQFDENSSKEVFKEKRREPGKILRRAENELAAVATQLDEADARSLKFLADRKIAAAQTGGGETAATTDSPPLPTGSALLTHLEQLRTGVTDAAAKLLGLKSVATAFAGGTRAAAILLPVLLGIAAGAAALFLAPGSFSEALVTKLAAAAAALVVVAGAGAGLGFWLISRMQKTAGAQAVALRAQLIRSIEDARRCLAAGAGYIKARHDAQLAKLDATFAEETKQRTLKAEADLTASTEKRNKLLADLESKYTEAVDKIEKKRASTREAAEQKYPARLQSLTTTRTEYLDTVARNRDERLAAADRRRDDRWREMTDAWRTVRTETAAVYDDANRIDAAAFRPWEQLATEECPLPTVSPPGLRFGQLEMSLERLPGGVSSRPEFNAFGPVAWTQPATVPFPVEASLLIKTTGDQKEVASEMMQALMLRIASGVPAGQTRFTIIDPLGLGKQYAGFMHLADYDELLVTSRIWTEPPQIEQCLADITEQIELVIQKYLRNEYESIGDYNADAEVPEPYRFVVVANFPANFTETSARRLASIAASGARCGVYTIVSVDTSQHMPSNFSLADLEKHATTLLLKDGVYTWSDPEFGKWPLTVEQPPSDEVFTQVIQRVGKAAKAAKRVEVPFDRVAPKEEEWWTGSTASEVLAPLGPAGAKKLQYMKLGKGTSQHALIAGKTGSGKSTLMHALITSLALNYSPNEIQFYLIDFKKGVEFKLYDHYKLPHARVIAIESEREFGLSVLEQLDRELKRRGDLFREFAVQDVAGFRQSGNGEPMPRILLIIDEFQEIFVEDDKIAQDASLILDRLVRQGRAFGMHVLLGSQTLGGSYSLPRATMGQMAVRIALQCNEADSSLILSEDNTAARLLTRPGEAIYNDANGMVAGNNPFQVVFLNDERRERYLGALRRLADRRTDIPALPRMVFDGNEAADPAGNAMLAELLGHGTVGGKSQTPPLAWLGDAIAIKDPTAAIFRRQGGANLLIVGQREDLGVSLLAMSIVSLAAAHDPHQGGGLGRAARFVVFEPAIAEEKPDILLANIAPSLPHETELVGRLGVGDAIQRLADEVRRRIDEQVLDGEAVYVIIRDLARFRELRRNEADFGYSSFGGEQKATPAQNLVALLKDGPPVGVHVLIWCDSLTNLQRTFERGTLKEFELRVLFQMSGSDSSQLVDSPAAVKLGPQRALFIHEETGTLEKFRPYAFPGGEWLAGVATAMRARPQGTPVERPVGTPSAATPKPAAAPGDDFGFTGTLGGGFGGDEFNFAKFLDDPPADGSPPDDAKQ
jgi:energy-coupling factor transporter ATP-binding protein EcfA2